MDMQMNELLGHGPGSTRTPLGSRRRADTQVPRGAEPDFVGAEPRSTAVRTPEETRLSKVANAMLDPARNLMHHQRPHALAFVFALTLAGGSTGCRTDSGELREWSPADHDNQPSASNVGTKTGQVDPTKPRPGMPDLSEHGVDEVVLATWKQNCVSCHGVIGRGDGPTSAAVRPPNFTDPEWQRVHLDEEMARSIQKGRGKMPAFSALPPETVQGLVRLIRLLNPTRSAAPPSASAPTSTKKGE